MLIFGMKNLQFYVMMINIQVFTIAVEPVNVSMSVDSPNSCSSFRNSCESARN